MVSSSLGGQGSQLSSGPELRTRVSTVMLPRIVPILPIPETSIEIERGPPLTSQIIPNRKVILNIVLCLATNPKLLIDSFPLFLTYVQKFLQFLYLYILRIHGHYSFLNLLLKHAITLLFQHDFAVLFLYLAEAVWRCSDS